MKLSIIKDEETEAQRLSNCPRGYRWILGGTSLLYVYEVSIPYSGSESALHTVGI